MLSIELNYWIVKILHFELQFCNPSVIDNIIIKRRNFLRNSLEEQIIYLISILTCVTSNGFAAVELFHNLFYGRTQGLQITIINNCNWKLHVFIILHYIECFNVLLLTLHRRCWNTVGRSMEIFAKIFLKKSIKAAKVRRICAKLEPSEFSETSPAFCSRTFS